MNLSVQMTCSLCDKAPATHTLCDLEGADPVCKPCGDEYVDQEFACNVAEDLDDGYTHTWRVSQIREAMRAGVLDIYIERAREVF